MVDKKTLSLNTLIASGLILVSMLVPGMFNEPNYFCESRPELGLHKCDSFSKYVSDTGKCIDDDGPNYICRTGWIQVNNDYEIDIKKEESKQYSIDNNSLTYVCDTKGCIIK